MKDMKEFDRTYTITNYFGEKVELEPRVELYSVNDFMGEELPGLAIVLDMVVPGQQEKEQYDVLTVSFGEFIGVKNCAYIDTNNCSFADQLLQHDIARDTGYTKQSGFCVYPLWEFDESFLKAIGGEKYKEYSDAYDKYMDANEYSEAWELVSRKEVADSDGFMTEYSWYTDGDVHIFIFGDSDVYTPDNTEPDRECDNEKEAQEWFDNYEGFVDKDEEQANTRSAAEMKIDGCDCLVFDEWTSGDNAFVLAVNKNDNSFYHASVNGKDFFEYDHEPSRKEVESSYDDLEAQRQFDEYEAEWGADGRRAFPNLNDDIAADSGASSTNKAIVSVAEKIHDFLYEHDRAFGYAEGMTGQENKEQWVDTISKDLLAGQANNYMNQITTLASEQSVSSAEVQDIVSQIELCNAHIKGQGKRVPLADKIIAAERRVVDEKSSSSKEEMNWDF